LHNGTLHANEIAKMNMDETIKKMGLYGA
jgi:hypothetical protein